jgi:hypothetical protein
MTADLLAPEVVDFLAHRIASVDQLEILVLLIEASTRWFDATTTSHQLGMSPERARSALDALAAHSLLDIRISDDIRYQFSPGRPDLERSALAAAGAYRRRPELVIQEVTRGASQGLRDSADAFRFRRRGDG